MRSNASRAVRAGRAWAVVGEGGVRARARGQARIVAMNVTVALLSALVVLPPMLVWADKRNWVSRGLVKPVEPYIETPPIGAVSPAD